MASDKSITKSKVVAKVREYCTDNCLKASREKVSEMADFILEQLEDELDGLVDDVVGSEGLEEKE